MADPITRQEIYLAYIAGEWNGELPTPVTREEQYLYNIAVNGTGSTVEVTQIKETGEKIATITVDGEATDIYASAGGGGGGAVDTVNGMTGDVILTASDVGTYTTAETDALLGDKQSKTLSASVKIGTETETTVEGAIGEVAAIIPATAAVSNKLSTAADTAKEDITATANSEDIALTDSADARVHDLRIYGKTENGHSVGENGLTVTAGGGYNLWDEQWELGTYNQDTGEKEAASSLIRSTNAISVNPEKTYYITAVGEPSTVRMMVLYYSKTEFIKALAVPVNAFFDVPINCYYIRFRMQSTYGVTYKHNITINVYNSNINGNYYPYKNLTLPISTALPLKGSTKTIDLGSIDWLYKSEGVEGDPVSFPRFSSYSYKPSDAYVPSIEFGVAMSSCSSRYTPAVDPVLGGNTDKTICLGLSKAIFIVDHEYTDAAAFKAAVTGITLTYPSYCDEIDLAGGVAITRLDSNGDVLATPVTTPISDAEKAAFAEFRTFDDNTNITATDDPFMALNYVKNADNGKALANVDNRIEETFTAISNIESVIPSTASSSNKLATAAEVATKQNAITQSSLLTLTVAGWDSTTLQQTVTFAHDTAKRNVIDITLGEMTTWGECGVRAVSETATGITFECDTVPETALTFKVTSMEVS